MIEKEGRSHKYLIKIENDLSRFFEGESILRKVLCVHLHCECCVADGSTDLIDDLSTENED